MKIELGYWPCIHNVRVQRFHCTTIERENCVFSFCKNNIWHQAYIHRVTTRPWPSFLFLNATFFIKNSQWKHTNRKIFAVRFSIKTTNLGSYHLLHCSALRCTLYGLWYAYAFFKRHSNNCICKRNYAVTFVRLLLLSCIHFLMILVDVLRSNQPLWIMWCSLTNSKKKFAWSVCCVIFVGFGWCIKSKWETTT